MFQAAFQLADGSNATTLRDGRSAALREQLPAWSEETPEGPVLVRRGRGGSRLRWVQDVWLWPLPPKGPLAFVCQWPALGIELTRAEIYSTLLHEAAARSQPLWEDR